MFLDLVEQVLHVVECPYQAVDILQKGLNALRNGFQALIEADELFGSGQTLCSKTDQSSDAGANFHLSDQSASARLSLPKLRSCYNQTSSACRWFIVPLLADSAMLR